MPRHKNQKVHSPTQQYHDYQLLAEEKRETGIGKLTCRLLKIPGKTSERCTIFESGNVPI